MRQITTWDAFPTVECVPGVVRQTICWRDGSGPSQPMMYSSRINAGRDE